MWYINASCLASAVSIARDQPQAVAYSDADSTQEGCVGPSGLIWLHPSLELSEAVVSRLQSMFMAFVVHPTPKSDCAYSLNFRLAGEHPGPWANHDAKSMYLFKKRSAVVQPRT